MSRENLLYRWWFDEALRSNTTDKDLRARILTAYVNKRSFKKSLDIENEKRVVAILVDPKGHVYWRADGPYKDADMTALLSVLDSTWRLTPRRTSSRARTMRRGYLLFERILGLVARINLSPSAKRRSSKVVLQDAIITLNPSR